MGAVLGVRAQAAVGEAWEVCGDASKMKEGMKRTVAKIVICTAECAAVMAGALNMILQNPHDHHRTLLTTVVVHDDNNPLPSLSLCFQGALIMERFFCAREWFDYELSVIHKWESYVVIVCLCIKRDGFPSV